MAGGTLVVSRAKLLFPFLKKLLEKFGFTNVTLTDHEKDGLNMDINDLKPRLVLMEAGFYQSATPYMTSGLLRRFKGINIAIVAFAPYPADLAMWFIINGVKSYITIYDGIDQFLHGLNCVREGKSYISPSVQKRIDIRDELPRPAAEITDRQLEVLRLVCNGFSGHEIADVLYISLRTVNDHKKKCTLV